MLLVDSCQIVGTVHFPICWPSVQFPLTISEYDTRRNNQQCHMLTRLNVLFHQPHFFFSSFHTVVLLSLIFIVTVKHNNLFINLLFLLITGCLYDYTFRSTCDHPQVYKSYYLHVLIVHQYFLKT